MRTPLLHFCLAGGLLFLMESSWSRPAETSTVEIRRSEITARLDAYQLQMGRVATAEEALAIENRVVEDALWFEQALALGLLQTDPVVRQRLVLNMRFLEGESQTSEDELVARAIELGMDRSDIVVRRRLIDRVQAILRAGVRAHPPDQALLEAHYDATAERWREPILLDLSQVYLSRDKRGDLTRPDAAALLARLERESLAPVAAIAYGDPFLAGHRLRGASPARIVARLGPVFASGVEHAPVGRWVGPIESAFGMHLVWSHQRQPSRIPELAEVRKRVLEDWIEEESRKALRAHIARRREVVEIRIIDDGAPETAAPGDSQSVRIRRGTGVATSLGSGS